MADQPDWTTDEPGQVPSGSSTSDYTSAMGSLVKGLGKGAVRASEFAFTPHTQNSPIFKPVFDWARSPGESLPEKAGTAVTEVGPYFLAPELGLERLAGRWATGRAIRGFQRGVQVSPTVGRLAVGAGKVGEGVAGGAVGGALAPADSAEDRGEDAKWGAAVGGALKGVGMAIKGVGNIAPGVRRRVSSAIGAAMGGALGHLTGVPFSEPGGAWLGLRLHLGDVITEALPDLIRRAGERVPSTAWSGAATGMAREKPRAQEAPDWTDKPPGQPSAPKAPAKQPPAAPNDYDAYVKGLNLGG